MTDFPSNLLDHVAHRPWPVRDAVWIMTQSWHDLLFAHWRVSARELRAQVPPGLELDLFNGEAWLAIVPFHMTNVAPRGVPSIPLVSAFVELNVRTYVTVGGKPGVYFFSLDANSRLAVTTARTMFHLPYYVADMEVATDATQVGYRSRRTSGAAHAEFVALYRPVGPAQPPEPGSLEHFLTERYCLYTLDEAFRAYRLEIHHAPWPLQPAEAEFSVNTMADAAGIRLPEMGPVLHFARRQDVLAWPLERL